MSASRPILARKDMKADYDLQRREVLERDGHVCRFETRRYSPAFKPFGATGDWVGCGSKNATDTAHIYRRRECGRASAHKDVALRACRDCHDAYDQSKGGVRVPPAREQRAWDRIVANSKVPPPRQTPEGARI